MPRIPPTVDLDDSALAIARARWPLEAALRRRGIPERDLEDLVQDAMLRALSARDRFDPGRPHLPWLLTIALRLRADRATTRPVGTGGPADTRSPWPAPDAAAVVLEEQVLLQAAVRKLPAAERGVFRLFYEEHLSVKAVAERLRMPTGTVKSHLHRARAALARAFAPAPEDRSP